MKACGYGSRIALACAHLSETTWIEFSRASMPVCIGRKHTVATTGGAGSSGLPCAMALTAYFVLPGDQALLPPSLAGSIHDLSASVGAPGPHDFAVRIKRRSSCVAEASTASHPRVRDDAYPPGRGGTMRRMLVIWGKAKYFCGKALDWTQKSQSCPSGKSIDVSCCDSSEERAQNRRSRKR